jgi:hypothetical protein
MHELADGLALAGNSYFHGARGQRLLRGLRRVIVSDFGDDPSPRWRAEDAAAPGCKDGALVPTL